MDDRVCRVRLGRHIVERDWTMKANRINEDTVADRESGN